MSNQDWKLESIRIRFVEGRSFFSDPEKKVDRYEGEITFSNKESESFTMNVKAGIAERYIELISEDVVKAAESLGERIKKSLSKNLKTQS